MNKTMQTAITGTMQPSLDLVDPSRSRRAAELKAAAWGAATVFAGMLAVGCGSDARPVSSLPPGTFLTKSVDSSINNPVDKPGLIPSDPYRVSQPPEASAAPVEVGSTVRELVKSPDAEARQEAANLSGRPAQPGTAPTTAPTTRDAQAYGWLLNGCVLEEINGTAIFSDKVISAIQKPLVAEAKKGDEYHFRNYAAELYERQIHLYERDELEYASAQKALEAEDEQTARGMTMQWRQKKITEAGGSLELARRRAAADGWDFDKQVEQQYRLHLVQIYYQKRIIPLIQVTAADLRIYYDMHKDTEFTTHGQARFRVIKINPGAHLGREDALNIAQEVRKRAATEDFADLARKYNDEPAFQATGGALGDKDGYVQKGAFRVQEVEEAVWKLRPGQVSDIISADRCFYIAKLEQLTEDKVEDFDSEQVQDKIRDQLRSQQFTEMREKHDRELRKEAIVRANDDAIRETLMSIIEQYPMWQAAR